MGQPSRSRLRAVEVAVPRRDWRARVDRLATQVICSGLAFMMAVWPVRAQQANVIITDGRTQTQLQTSGNVTNVTTSTVSGANGFNSFSQFGVGAGNTVNLHLPTGTQNLINIVRDAPAYVNGTLNAYKNGQIGGNVYFADPYGFVVGRTGVVNVGSLNVSTPTREFVDGMISPSGQINEGAVANLLAGTVPISPDGNIRIKGRINAVDAVRLTGQNVFVGSGRDAAVNREQATRFASTVNSRGLRSANNIVVRNGSIQIVAANDAHVTGKMVARSRPNSNARGDIVVTAGNAIRIASTAKLNASSKTGNAGNILLRAGQNLTLASGASFDASSAVGDGGIVETSSFGRFNIASGIKVNVGAPNGKAGTLLVDPIVTVIGDDTLDAGVTLSNAGVRALVTGLTNGGTLLIQALGEGSSITLAEHAVIDTRRLVNNVSTGNAFDVTLESPKIEIKNGAQILTQAINSGTSYTSGTVRLIASLSDSQLVGGASASTEIIIAGTVSAGNIYATATSTATASWLSSSQSIGEFAGSVIIGAISGISGGYVKAEATAKVTVESTARLTASGDIVLSAIGEQTANTPAFAAAFAAAQSALSAAVVVGIVNADVATQVKSGAQINGGNFSAIAINHATLDVTAQAFSLNSSLDGALAYTTGTINTRATIDPGVVFNDVNNITVGAQNNNSFSTTASSIAAGPAFGAIAVAISDIQNHAVANLGASVPQSASAGLVTVYSGSTTAKNAVFASSTVGSNPFTGPFVAGLHGGTSIGDIFANGGAFDQSGAGQAAALQNTITSVRAGVTLALNLSTLTSSASIDNLAPDTSGNMVRNGSAPTINASSVVVISNLVDAGIRGSASSTINSASDPTTKNTATGAALSMAVNVTQIDQSSTAYIGSGASITAPTVGVRAETVTPITITWLDFDSFADVTAHITGSFGVSGTILTTYANATFDTTPGFTPDSTQFGLSGAVNYFEVNTNTTAWISSGATITQTGGGNCAGGSNACWTTNLANSNITGAPSSYSWSDNVTVMAVTDTSSINVGGNFSWLKFFGTNSSDGTAIGGSANVNKFNTNTVAGVGAGVVVSASGSVAVSARTSDLIYAVSPTSGSGSGLGLNGIASVLMIDNYTSASVSKDAQITTAQLSVDAEQTISSFDVAGAIGTAKGAGIGISVALAQASTDTNAIIGDNSDVLINTGATAIDGNVAPVGAGFVSAPVVNVSALSVGRLTTVAVAALSANNTPNPLDPTQPPGDDFLTTAAKWFKNPILFAQAVEAAFDKLDATVSGPVNGGGPTAGAGSAAVDLTSIGTHASVSGATIRYGSSAANTVSVQAVNNTIIDTASGSAALSKGAPGSEYAVGLAGAVAVTLSSDMTTATISRSTVTVHGLAVQAVAGGESTTVGLAVALTAGAGAGTQASAAVSIAEIKNGVQALVDGSVIGDSAITGTASIAIAAYQKTNIGIGGGSLYGGLGTDGSKGIGVAMTYALIDDPTSGQAVSAILSNSKVQYTRNLDVIALDNSRIIAGAAVAGGGPNASGFAGSVVVTDIDSSTLALITSVPAETGAAAVTGGITVSGDVRVNAFSGSDSHLDAILSNAAFNANGGLTPGSDSGLDFAATELHPNSAVGAAIIAVAGNLQLTGGSNVGISIAVNRIGTSHEAYIDRTTVTSSGGVVDVAARDGAEIIGIAVGVGASSGAAAGNGSVVYNAISNMVVAQIGHGVVSSGDPLNTATATVSAAAVAVTAEATGKIRSAAGAISLSFGGGDAVGLSAAVSQIGTYVSAAIAGASVTATNTLSNNSALIAGNLRAGNVLVSGSSSADIITVSIGTAITAGNNSGPPPPPPSTGLSTLLTRLAPMSTGTLTGMGGGTPTPPVGAQQPSVPSDGMSGAGSIAISTQSSRVSSSIVLGGANVGSTVTALGNVLVLADNDNGIAAYAGALSASFDAGKGLGASVVVNTINGETGALLNGATVDARGRGSDASIDNGVLASGVDPSAVVMPASAPNLNNGTQTIKGVAVVATSAQSAQTVSALLTASSNGVAIAANAITNVMGGRTSAEVLSSDLNKNLQTGDVSAVQVTASSASFANNLDLGLSDSGGSAAGTIALTINLMNRTTVARMTGTDVGSSSRAAGAVGVKANAFQSTSSNVMGAAGSGGSAALSGSSLANKFQSTTQAIVEQGSVYAGSMSVTASGLNGFFATVGAAAVASSTGVGATVLVAISDNLVQAVVGDDDPASTATDLNLSGALSVTAANTTKTSSYVIVGSFAGSLAIGAQFSGMFINNNVYAALRNASVDSSGSGADGAVLVRASETDSIAPVVGGLSAGGSVGFGAAVNLVSFKSNTRALMAGATVNTDGAVAVEALSTRDINPITVTANLGGSVGLAATVGVVLVDSGASSDAMSVLNAGADDDSSSGTLGNARTATGVDVLGGIGGNSEGVAAQILTSGVNAGAIGITASSEMATRNIVGTLAAGLSGGIGAAVAFTTVTQKVTAEAVGGTLTSNAIAIGASAGDHGSGQAVTTIAAAGAGGLYVGLGAAVAESHIDNTVRATLGATATGRAGGLTGGTVAVTASDTSSIDSSSYGLAVGIAAAGLSLANSEKSSEVTAEIAGSTQVTNVANVAVMATGGGSVASDAKGGAGGVIAGAGAAATASDAQTIIAQIGDSARVQAAGTGVLVYASGTPDVSARSKGAVVAGVGIGASTSLSDASLTVTASVGNNTNFFGSGALTVSAVAAVPANDHSAYAQAIAAVGGSLYGLQGSFAEANNKTKVHAYGGTGVRLPSADVSIASQNDTDQYADATGVSGGYVAAGATITKATSDGESKAWLDTGAIANDASNNGSLSIVATGIDTNVATSTAGSGGLSAGAAATASTDTKSTVTAELRGNATANTLYVTGFGIRAEHTTNYAANGDAFQASAIGASGGAADNNVESTVNAKVGTNLIVNSYGRDRVTGRARDMNVIAIDTVNQTSGGARAGSGGGVAAAASLSETTVTQTINTLIGSGTILSLNDDPLTSLSKVNIEGYATLLTTDTVSLTAAGLFAGGGGKSNMTATATITVRIDAARLFSAGDIDIGSAAKMIANNSANASLYGLVGGVGASSSTDLTATQNVTIGGTRIEAWGLVNLYAGKAGDGSRFSQIQANATTTVYNNTLIAISAEHGGYGKAYGYATLTIDSGSLVLGANNVFVGATQGAVEANGRGTLYSPFLELFSTEDHDNHSDSNGSHRDDGDNHGRGDVIVNGKVMAGIHNQAIITIGLNGAVNLDTSGTPCALLAAGQSCALTLEQKSDPSQFSSIMSWDHQKVQWSLTGGFSPYQDVLQQIAALSGLTTSQVDAAILGNQQIAAINDDADHNKQRQVDTLIQQAPFASRGSNQVFTFGDILASAGAVSVLAESLTGSGQLVSQGTAAINIDNRGLKFTSLNKLTIWTAAGGRTVFTGRANDQNSPTLTYRNDTSGTAPIISVTSSYRTKDPNTGRPVDEQGNPLETTPDIYFNGVVSNSNGLFSITNQLGSVVATQNFVALAIEMNVPEGAFTFNGGAGTVYNWVGDVASQWNSTQFRPLDTLTAVELAATWLGTYGSIYVGGVSSAHPYQYFSSNTHGNQNDVVTNYGTSASTIFTARMLSLGYANKELWSAIFLPMNGIPDAQGLATGEGTTVDKIIISGWERGWFENQAYGDGGHGGPFNCSGCGRYFQVVKIQDAAVQPVTAEATGVARGELTIGKAVIITAGIININGKVTVGQTSNYSANIGQSAQDVITGLKGDADALARARTDAAAGKYVDLTDYVVANGTDVRIGARYDALNDQILLNSVVQGTGGYVYLNGKIISTSTSGLAQGEIVVNGGAGTVNVANSTGVTLVTNTINTGVTAASVVQLVDRLKGLTTWYVYNAGAAAGQQVTTYQIDNLTTSNYQTSGVRNLGQSGPTGISYATKENMYYQWVDTARLYRSPTSQSNDYGWQFIRGPGSSPNDPWSRSAPSLVENVQQIQNGQAAGNQWTNFQQVVSATGIAHDNSFPTGNACCGTDFTDGTWHQQIYYDLSLTLTNTVKASYPISVSFNGGGVSSVDVRSNSSIVLNGPINNLQGTTSVTTTGANSSITVAPGAINPLVSGTRVTLNGEGGIGSVDRPVPVQIYGGALTAISKDRDIAVSSAGSLRIDQVRVDAARNNATTGKPEPQGNVYITASGDINSASPYNVNVPVVIGKSITIDSTSGAIGAITTVDGQGHGVLSNINPLVIQTWATTLPGGTTDGGVLDSTSVSGSYLVQSTGDLRIGTVTAADGPVFIAAMTGSILSGHNNVGLTEQQQKYLESVWASLDLVNGSGAAQVASYESLINSAYRDYWQLRGLAYNVPGHPDQYNITDLGVKSIGAQLIAAGVLAAGTDLNSADALTAIQTEVSKRYLRAQFLLGMTTAAELPMTLTALFNVTAAEAARLRQAPGVSNVALGAYDADYRYTLSTTSDVYAAITDRSQWSLDQLRYTVTSGATAANPPSISSLPLNVSGRQVMLFAPNGSIGSLAAPEQFSFTSVDASNLTTAQKGLLATAGPGQLTVTPVVDQVTGITTYNVTVQQQKLVIVNPLGPVAAKAKNDIYLGSATDIVLGGISAATFGPIVAAQTQGIQTTASGGGSVRLVAVNSIYGVHGQVAISGNIARLTLIAENGAIGRATADGEDPADNPDSLLLALTGANGGALDQVSAKQGIFIRQTTGDLVLGQINADQGSAPIELAATGSMYGMPSFTDFTIPRIFGSTLDVRANGTIGYSGSTLQPLLVRIAGGITGRSAGDLAIYAPDSNMTLGGAGAYGGLKAGGRMTFSAAAGSITTKADIESNGALQFLANAGVTFVAGTAQDSIVAKSTAGDVLISAAALTMGAYTVLDAAGVLTVATTGAATLGQLVSRASYAAAGNAASIVVAASAGAILSNRDALTDLVTTGFGARVSLNAHSIGTSSAPVGIDAPLLAATATQGGIYLNAVSDLEASLLSAVRGNIDILAGGALTIGSATSGGMQTIRAANDVTFGTLTTTGITGDDGNVNVTADTGKIEGTEIAANGSAALTAATTNKGTTLAATLGAVTLNAGGLIDWTTVTAGTTVDARSTGDSANFGTVTSNGTQTLRAANNVTFGTLTTNGITGDDGNVNVTADTGKIEGTEVAANGSATLIAATTNKGTTLAATLGAVALNAGGLIDWTTVTAGTTVDARSTGDSANFGTVTSNGTQALRAANDVTFGTLTTTGITGDDGNVNVTADTGKIEGTEVAANGSATLIAATTNKGTTLAATLGAVALNAGGLIDWTTVTAGTTADARSTGDSVTFGTVTSGGTQTIRAANDVTFGTLTTNGITGDDGNVNVTADTGKIEGTEIAANGSATLTAATTNKGTTLAATLGAVTLNAGGLIDWTTVTAGTTVDARSTGDGAHFGTVTSGGTQTIRAANDVTFGALTTTGNDGNVNVTADTGKIEGTEVAANGSATLIAATTNKGTTLAATLGAATLNAGGLIDWATVAAGTTVDARSTGDNATFGTVTSGGTQALRAANNVTFGTLTTNGITGDDGNVNVTAETGKIEGTEIAANGSAALIAATTNKGTTLAATLGAVALNAGGLIDWATVTAGTTVDARSTGDNATFGTVTSGGTQTIRANQNVTFGALTTTGIPGDLGDIIVIAENGSINAGTVTANGDASFASGQSIVVSTMQAGSAKLSAPQNLTVGMLRVYRAMSLGANVIDVTAVQLPSLPPVPLHVKVTGYQGGVATLATLNIDPPQVVIDQFRVVDSTVVVDSPSLTITSGYVPGQMLLTTPAGQILLDNRSPGPVGGNNLQLYQPGGIFTMQQIGNANFSNTQVVYYDTTISSTIINYGGGSFTGSAFIRNAIQDMRNGDNGGADDLQRVLMLALYLQGFTEGWRGLGAVQVIGNGPAVNIEGLYETGGSRKSRKGYRSNLRSSAVENRGAISFASAAYGR